MLRNYPSSTVNESGIAVENGKLFPYIDLFNLYGRLSIYHTLPSTEKDATNKLFTSLKNCIEDYILASALGEIRHLFEQSISSIHNRNRNLNLIGNPFYLKLFGAYANGSIDLSGRNCASRDLWDNFQDCTYSELFSHLELLFISHRWAKAYGGFPWGYIMHCAHNLSSAPDLPSQILAFDRLMHAAHCCSPVFLESKFDYFKVTNILNILTFKRFALVCCWKNAANLYPSWGLPSSFFPTYSPQNDYHLCKRPLTPLLSADITRRNQDELKYINRQFRRFKKSVLEGKAYQPWIALIN